MGKKGKGKGGGGGDDGNTAGPSGNPSQQKQPQTQQQQGQQQQQAKPQQQQGPRQEGKPQQQQGKPQQQQGKPQQQQGQRQEGKPQKQGQQQQGKPQQQQDKPQQQQGQRQEGKPQKQGQQQQGKPQQQQGKPQQQQGQRQEGKPQQPGQQQHGKQQQQGQQQQGKPQQQHGRPQQQVQQQQGRPQTQQGQQQQQQAAPSPWGQPQSTQSAWGQPQATQSAWGQPQAIQSAWGQPQAQPQQQQQQQQRPPPMAVPTKSPSTEKISEKMAQLSTKESQRVQQAVQQPQQKQSRSSSVSSQVSVAPSTGSSGSKATTATTKSSGGSDFLSIPTAAAIPLAPHKQPGTKGRRVGISVNYLALNLKRLIENAYHYDINIEPNMPKRFMPRVFEEFRKINYPNVYIAFDGKKNAIAPHELPIKENLIRQVTILDPDNAQSRVYMVAIKEVKTQNKINMKSLQTYQQTRQFDAPLRALQCLEIILKSVFVGVSGVQCGRSFFTPPKRPFDLGEGFELWTGLFQSAILGAKPYLNVDIAHKAFPTPTNLVNLCGMLTRDFNSQDYMQPRSVTTVANHLRGLRITYEQPGQVASKKTYKFQSFGQAACDHVFMNDQAKKKMSVAEYFESRGFKLRFPKLPTLIVGNEIRKVNIPLELCSVCPNQAVMRKCTENQTRAMIKESATSTLVRKQKIMDILSQIRHNEKPTLEQFGIEVANDFTNIDARILDPPILEYADQRPVMVSRGEWKADRSQFIVPSLIDRWAVLSLCNRVYRKDIMQLVSMLVKYGGGFNMKINGNPIIIEMGNSRSPNIDTELNDFIKQKIQLVVIIIPNFSPNFTYAKIKQAAEIRCGILTQCLKSYTVQRKCEPSTISNILLKINAKLNGTNHKLGEKDKVPQLKKSFMIIGGDVTHPSPDQTRIPSVVGVAASYDTQAYKYKMCWRLQDPRQEMIQDFKNIIRELLLYYMKNNQNTLPQHLFYYRDGVSDGQFQQVLATELRAMEQACATVKQGYKPLITFLVVQKRHHTRFFPGRDERICSDRNKNVPPGTIVDTEITHPNETQFFLVSHQSIQGVAKPTKYCLLKDDANMSLDDLEALTYHLCHMFTRCTRSVSYPAPTYYAHLAAYRGRVYIEEQHINMLNLENQYQKCKIKDVIINDHPMYFV